MSVRIYDNENFRRPMMLALVVGLAAAGLAIAGLFLSGPEQFYQAYLLAFTFWWGISMGSLAFLLLHFTTGSRWGLTLRRVAGAASGNILLMAVLFIPLLLGMQYLYPWTNPDVVSASEALQAKSWYLNVPFFIIRAVIYFIVWLLLAQMAQRTSARLAQALPEDLELRGQMQLRGALGLIALTLTITFASIDWLMSLQPLWTSTAFGLIIIAGQLMSALSFGILMLNLLPGASLAQHWTAKTTPIPYKDLGALLLVFVMGWAYLSYFQLLIIWAGNLPHEVSWYIDRTTGGWQIIITLIALFQFALPFLMLISSRVRHSLRILALLGGLLLLTNFLNVFWHVKPAFSPGVLAIHWLDIVLPVAMGGIWLAGFLLNLARRPALTAGEREAMHITDVDRQEGVVT